MSKELQLAIAQLLDRLGEIVELYAESVRLENERIDLANRKAEAELRNRPIGRR